MLKLVTAGTALVFVVALIFGTAAFSRWLAPLIASRCASGHFRLRHVNKKAHTASHGKLVSQVDQKRCVHIAELGGCRFAILTGGPNDVMIALPDYFHREHES